MKGKKANQFQRRNPTSRAIRERDSIPWKYCLLTLICGSFLVVGFFGAARQHFASIDYGIKNSKLRKEIKDLEAEQKRLIFAREMAYSPVEIKKSAKKFGFTENYSKFPETFTAVKISEKQTETVKSENTEDKKESSDEKTKTEKDSKSEKPVEVKKKSEEKIVKKDEKLKSGKDTKDKEPKKTNKSKEDKNVTAKNKKVST
jgi:hypothetical protein